MSLVLTNLFRTKPVGCTVKMLGEILDDSSVGFCGTMRVMTTLEFLQHHFPKMGHRDLLVTRNLSERQNHPICSTSSTRQRPPRQRLRPNPINTHNAPPWDLSEIAVNNNRIAARF